MMAFAVVRRTTREESRLKMLRVGRIPVPSFHPHLPLTLTFSGGKHSCRSTMWGFENMTRFASVYSIGFVLCAAFVLKWRQYRLRRGLPLPPGPTGLPLVGNVFDLNPQHPWLSYEQWGKQYGAFDFR